MNARTLFLIAGATTLGACMPEPEVDGRLAFVENCASCHGTDGMGTGEMADLLTTAPPDLTTLSRRNGGVFPRDEVMSTIDGYRRGTHFSAAMPAFGDGDLGPTVIVENPDGTGTPVPILLLALSDYLQSIQR